jgi:aminoglycoside phosphotransferase (APT) family kinase protein
LLYIPNVEQLFPGWARRIEAAFADEFPDASDVRVDRIRRQPMGADRELYQLRVRWREGEPARSALLAMRLCPDAGSCVREVEALEEAGRAGVPAPAHWLVTPDDPPCLLFDWVEGRTFASMYRQRLPRASAELLAELLVQLHDGTERGGTALCHGDYRPENVLLDASGRATVVGWSHAHRGDPIRDVARAVDLIEADFGGLLRAPFLRTYRRYRPVPPDRLEALLESKRDRPTTAETDPPDRPGRRWDAPRPERADHGPRPRGDPGGPGGRLPPDARDWPPPRQRPGDRG